MIHRGGKDGKPMTLRELKEICQTHNDKKMADELRNILTVCCG